MFLERDSSFSCNLEEHFIIVLSSSDLNFLIEKKKNPYGQVNELILPLEPLLTSGALLASSLARLSSSGVSLTESMVDRSLGYGHNAAVQNHSSLKETSAVLSETISSLLSAVKNLHSCLSKLIRTASSDAGFLHKVYLWLFHVLLWI